MPLYVVATPIGNADDITLRALEILRSVHVIAAEDTRKTGRLLARHDIKTRLISHHDHNERASAPAIISMLSDGNDVALVTNAGTPLLSDPGYVLVTQAIANGIDVIPLPGPSSIVAALSVSGLPVHELHFMGFAPKKKVALTKSLQSVSSLGGTIAYFESPHRIASFLATALETLGDRPAAVAREMTKLHEEVVRGTLSELTERYADATVKGEIVVLIAGT